jgi:hypothetical protein
LSQRFEGMVVYLRPNCRGVIAKLRPAPTPGGPRARGIG